LPVDVGFTLAPLTPLRHSARLFRRRFVVCRCLPLTSCHATPAYLPPPRCALRGARMRVAMRAMRGVADMRAMLMRARVALLFMPHYCCHYYYALH